MNLTSFILAFMLWMEPLMKHSSEEDPSLRLERYKAIAADIAEVCQDPSESPVFDGDNGRLKTCMLIASIARNESGFKESIDLGTERGDGGKSVGIMQVQHGQKGSINFTLEELKNRKTNIRAGLKILRAVKCNNGSNMDSMLRAYVSGSCTPLDDPKRDSVVLKTSMADASGYVAFMKQHRILPKVKMEVKSNKDEVNSESASSIIMTNIIRNLKSN